MKTFAIEGSLVKLRPTVALSYLFVPNLIHFQFKPEQRYAANKGLAVRHRLRNDKFGILGKKEDA
jgi:hypothetical protein